MAQYDQSILQDPRFKELPEDVQARIISNLAPPEPTTIEKFNRMVGSAHETVGKGIAGAIDMVPGISGSGETISRFVNPVPASITDLGQLAGTAIGTMLPGGPLARIGWNILSSMGGRMGGAAVEGRDVASEGIVGAATGMIPGAVSLAKTGIQTGMARTGSKKVTDQFIKELNSLLPAGPKFSTDMAKLQKQLSSHESGSLIKHASAQFADGLRALEQIPFGNTTIGKQRITLPSLRKPITLHDLFEIFSGRTNPAKLISENDAGKLRPEAIRQALMQEFSEAADVTQWGKFIKGSYENLRNEMHKTMTGVRLLKDGLDLQNGKIDLIKLQNAFKEQLIDGEFGGLTGFKGGQDDLSKVLGRGKTLTASDQRFNVPWLSGTSHGSVRVTMPTLVDLPRAAGVEITGPNAASQILVPQMIGSQFSRVRENK